MLSEANLPRGQIDFTRDIVGIPDGFALFKEFRVKERHRVQFRWESFNFLNTPQFSAPNSSVGSATLGRITSTINNNCEMQLGLKYFL